MKFIFSVLLGALCLINSVHASNEYTIHDYVAAHMFEKNNIDDIRSFSQHLEIATELHDNKLYIFDLYADLLLTKGTLFSHSEDHVAWLIKTIGFSENRRYLATIEKIQSQVPERSKVGRYVKSTLEKLTGGAISGEVFNGTNTSKDTIDSIKATFKEKATTFDDLTKVQVSQSIESVYAQLGLPTGLYFEGSKMRRRLLAFHYEGLGKIYFASL